MYSFIHLNIIEIIAQNIFILGIPGSPVVWTLHFHCRGSGIPSQELRPMMHGMAKIKESYIITFSTYFKKCSIFPKILEGWRQHRSQLFQSVEEGHVETDHSYLLSLSKFFQQFQCHRNLSVDGVQQHSQSRKHVVSGCEEADILSPLKKKYFFFKFFSFS